MYIILDSEQSKGCIGFNMICMCVFLSVYTFFIKRSLGFLTLRTVSVSKLDVNCTDIEFKKTQFFEILLI